MEQKRHSDRHDTILYLQVYSAKGKKPIARLIDMSSDGALLLSESSFPLEEPFAAVIALPQVGTKETKELSCTLTPHWSKPDYNPDFTLTGCTMEFDSGQRLLINEFMREYGFNGEAPQFRS